MEGIAAVNGIWRQLEMLDKDLTLAINSCSTPITDWMWKVFSDKEIWYVMYLVVLFFMFRNLGWKKALIVLASVILTIVCCDQLSNLTKDFFHRLRPCIDGEMAGRGLIVLEGFSLKYCYGFFSAHAANAMGFAVASAAGLKNDSTRNYGIYTGCITAWALLVGFSRIFVGKHYLGDVLTGFVVGVVFAWCLARLASFAIRKLVR